MGAYGSAAFGAAEYGGDQGGAATLERSASLSAVGLVSVAGQRDVLRAVSLSATASISVSGGEPTFRWLVTPESRWALTP